MSVINVIGKTPDAVFIVPYTVADPTETVDVYGKADFSLAPADQSMAGMEDSEQVTVGLMPHSTWTGSISTSFKSSITVDGPGKFSNVNSWIDASTIVNSDVIGAGLFTVVSNRGGGNLAFMRSVDAGQTVKVAGGEYGSGVAVVQLDDPHNFHASVDMGILSNVLLAGVHASSYAYNGTVLSLFSGNRVIDTLHAAITLPQDFGFSATQTASGVSLFVGTVYVPAPAGITLPVHHG